MDDEARSDLVKAFTSLPARIYLDSSTLQRMFDYGGELFENEPFVPSQRAARVPGLAQDLEALRKIFIINKRAMFEFVVTRASLHEVSNRAQPSYTQWVRDVEDTWLIQSEGLSPWTTDQPRIGSVSAKDWVLIADALNTDCDAFLTMDGPLLTQAPVIEHKTGLRVMRPTTFWDLLAPWARLYT